jgi:hypothetical protein
LSASKGREGDVKSQDLQGGSPHPCWLRTDVLTLVNRY